VIGSVILQKKSGMKNAAIVLNAVLLVAVGILFYLHFSPKKEAPKKEVQRAVATNDASFRIAYFEWDSMTNHFGLFKQMQEELNNREEAIGREEGKMRQQLQDKFNYYNAKTDMSQAESEAATQDLKQLESQLGNRMQRMKQDFQAEQMQKNNDIKSKIEAYLKDFNKDKSFAYIMIYEPSLIFYRDSAYNITPELISGLNERYPKKK
jgi:outer membrane protein